MKTMLELFAGIGGFSIGLGRVGLQTVGFIENNPHAQKVLAKNWPDIPRHGDVQTYQFREGESDVITAGFPCPDISFAGKGAGITGERSSLYREVVRAIRLVRPQVAILENVAALLRRGLGRVLGDLAEIGHDTEWHCIPAGVLGAPHARDRTWIVAYPHGSRLEGCWANAERPRKRSTWAGFSPQDWQEPHADLYREPDGLPHRSHRLERLGNAIVPDNAELIGRAILASMEEQS